jgi:hypothetical protein
MLDPLSGQRLRSRQIRQRSSSCEIGARTTALTRGSSRLYANSARQRIPVDLVSFRSPALAGCRNRGGINDMAFDSLGLQHAVNPKAVETGPLDDDHRETPFRANAFSFN